MTKQLSFLGRDNINKSEIWHLFIDGAARGNPGPAGIGVYLIYNKNPIGKKAVYLGKKTNNQAEYFSLIVGLLFAQNHMKFQDLLNIKSDSELLVRQIGGYYSVKSPNLIKLHKIAKDLLSKIDFVIEHIPRERNKIADKLANEAIDKKYIPENGILSILKNYGIY